VLKEVWVLLGHFIKFYNVEMFFLRPTVTPLGSLGRDPYKGILIKGEHHALAEEGFSLLVGTAVLWSLRLLFHCQFLCCNRTQLSKNLVSLILHPVSCNFGIKWNFDVFFSGRSFGS